MSPVIMGYFQRWANTLMVYIMTSIKLLTSDINFLYQYREVIILLSVVNLNHSKHYLIFFMGQISQIQFEIIIILL